MHGFSLLPCVQDLQLLRPLRETRRDLWSMCSKLFLRQFQSGPWKIFRVAVVVLDGWCHCRVMGSRRIPKEKRAQLTATGDKQPRKDRTMTRSQKILTVAALALFCASIALAPWVFNDRSGIQYGPIFLAPNYCKDLQWQNLIVEWLAIGIIYGWLFWLFKHMTFKLPRIRTILKGIAWTLLTFAVIVGLLALIAYMNR